jgi:hypothetical protein
MNSKDLHQLLAKFVSTKMEMSDSQKYKPEVLRIGWGSSQLELGKGHVAFEENPS